MFLGLSRSCSVSEWTMFAEPQLLLRDSILPNLGLPPFGPQHNTRLREPALCGQFSNVRYLFGYPEIRGPLIIRTREGNLMFEK